VREDGLDEAGRAIDVDRVLLFDLLHRDILEWSKLAVARVLTRQEMTPSSSRIRLTTRSISSCSVTSSAAVSQPASANGSISSGSRAVAYTVQPSSAKASAVARPIPDEQPVMSTVFGCIPNPCCRGC